MLTPVTITTQNSIFNWVIDRCGFFAKGLHWLFYMNEDVDFVFRTSPDGLTWSGETIERVNGGRGSVVWDGGDYVHIVRIFGMADVRYRRGFLNADGTIVWDAEQIVINVIGEQYVGAVVILDSNGLPWATWLRFDGANWQPFACRSTTNDGTWTTPGGFPFQLTAVSSRDWIPFPVALTGGDVYVLYCIYGLVGGLTLGRLWDASVPGWGGEEAATTTMGGVTAVAIGDDVYLCGITPLARFPGVNVQIRFVRRVAGVGWSAETLLYDTGSRSPFHMSMTVDRDTNELYLFWAHLSNQTTITNLGDGNIYLLRRNALEEWDPTPTAWCLSETLFRDGDGEAYCVSYPEKYEEYIGLVWRNGIGTPWNLRFCMLTLLPSSLKTAKAL